MSATNAGSRKAVRSLTLSAAAARLRSFISRSVGSVRAAPDRWRYIRSAFFLSFDEPVSTSAWTKRPGHQGRPHPASALFVIPYPPGFPIPVPGQVISAEIQAVRGRARRADLASA
jgi:hypothetical protein